MHRTDLLEEVRALLGRAGFAVSERCDLRPVSFDLVARRDQELLLVKVLTNVDAISDAVAHEIKLLCRFLGARPILVGLRAGTGPLEDGVMYNRHDIPIVTPGTLAAQYLHGERPLVYAAPGGFYVNLDPRALREARQALDLSLGVVAQLTGVSRRAIQMYEQGMSASIDAAMRLEEALGAELVRPVDPTRTFDPAAFEPQPAKPAAEDPTQTLVRNLLEALGYEVRSTQRSPFNALSTQADETLLTGTGADSPQLRRRARIVASVSRITERPGFFVVERTTHTSIEGVPTMSRRELLKLSEPEAILAMIFERQPASD